MNYQSIIIIYIYYRFHAAHPLNTLEFPTTSTNSAAKFKCEMGDDDSNIYEQADSLYETILDNSPYSDIPTQPPPLPDSNHFTSNAQPQSAAEPQKSSSKPADNSDDYSKPTLFPFEGRTRRCPSPVEYAIMKPDASPAPDYETYSTAVVKCGKPGQLESGEEYLPMFDEQTFFGDATSKTTYQNLLQESPDKEHAYQTPTAQSKMKTQKERVEEEGGKGIREEEVTTYQNLLQESSDKEHAYQTPTAQSKMKTQKERVEEEGEKRLRDLSEGDEKSKKSSSDEPREEGGSGERGGDEKRKLREEGGSEGEANEDRLGGNEHTTATKEDQ